MAHRVRVRTVKASPKEALMQATTNPIAAVPSRSTPSPARPRGRRLERSLQWLDESLDALLASIHRLGVKSA
jgi:hypothetical protein